MKHTTRLAVFATAAFGIAGQQRAPGDAAVTFGSTPVNVVNLRSDGSIMGEEFTFQLGAFATGFSPSAQNTDEWLARWVPLCDAAGDPVVGATAAYETAALQSPPFPDGSMRVGFAGTATYDHNQPPFTEQAPVYIWGYDNRDSAGAGEWILATSSAWAWPNGTTNPPAETFSMGTADQVVLGAINGDGFHMQSAAVTVSGSSSSPAYDAWLAAQFEPGRLADPALADSVWGVLADPDADGVSNVIEYFTASDPNDPASAGATAAGFDGEDLIFTFRRALDTSGVEAQVEWSPDLDDWRTTEAELLVVEELGDHELVEVRIPTGGIPDAFARLRVQRIFE